MICTEVSDITFGNQSERGGNQNPHTNIAVKKVLTITSIYFHCRTCPSQYPNCYI